MFKPLNGVKSESKQTANQSHLIEEEERKDEQEKQRENKMEKALNILNEVQSTLTEQCFEFS